MSKDDRRINRKHILDALRSETGVDDGSTASARIRAYRQDPTGASTVEFSFCGGLAVRRWYVAPGRPNQNERRSLWQQIMTNMGKSKPNPGGWDGNSSVGQLQLIAEKA